MRADVAGTHVEIVMRRLVLALVALGFFLSGCGDGGSETLTITEAESTHEVLVDSGDRIEIVLESNPTTGYEWVVTEAGWPDCVQLIEQGFEAGDTSLVGAPGQQTFVLEAADEGAGIVRLEYVRSFEDPVIPEKVVEYIVRVDSAPWPPVDPGAPSGTSEATAP